MDGKLEWLERLAATSAEDTGVPPRTLVVVAHPDDESVGAGALLGKLRPVFLLCATDGAPRNLHDATAAGFATREEYAAARRAELFSALRQAGISPEFVQFGGIADQEATIRLSDLVDIVARSIREIAPEVVLTHPYEGGHPDHDAVALAVHAACRLIAQQNPTNEQTASHATGNRRPHGAKHNSGELSFGSEIPRPRTPVIVEMASYHMGPGGMVTGRFLPDENARVIQRTLTECERQLKSALFDCYRTQHLMLSQFSLDAEHFRLAPHYDFTAPPHPGKLFYEQFDWGMTGQRWRQLAGRLLHRLQLRGPL